MNPLKIGIVEDSLLTSEIMSGLLRQIGYYPIRPVRDYDSALYMIQTETPDLMLIDIMIIGEMDGIDLARKISLDYDIPFVFITACSDASTVDRAKDVNPSSYLIKPVNKEDLYSAIEIAYNSHSIKIREAGNGPDKTSYQDETILIKETNVVHRVKIKDICFIESDNVYLTIHTSKKKYLVRSKMNDFVSNLPPNFVKVHRSFVINVKHLETISKTTARVVGTDIPVHSNYRQNLLKVFKAI
jgi:DNA-binding LytR/AlgR family response regulator